MFDCGHVQNIEIDYTNTTFIRAICHPEMEKDHIYNLQVSTDQNIYDITAVSCDYPTGKGPSANCKQVLVEFCASGKLPEFLTCTEILQQWNKAGHKKVNCI